MRLALAAVLLGVAVVAVWVWPAASPAIRLSIGPAFPTTDEGDGNPLGERVWTIDPDLVMRSSFACQSVSVEATHRVLYDGFPVPDRALEPQPVGPNLGSHRGPFRASGALEDTAAAGETIELSAVARCVRPGGGSASGSATRRFQMSAASCDAGPLRVYELSGHVTRTDRNREGRPVALHEGDLVDDVSGVDVLPGARVVIGAAECNGYRVTMGPGRYVSGSYDESGRGNAFFGAAASATGDAHAGGFAVENFAELTPISPPCDYCGGSLRLSGYAFRPVRGRLVVRVTSGALLVSGWSRTATRLLAGQETTVARRGEPSPPKVFQPDEPWAAAVSGPRRLPSVVVWRSGGWPPARRLAPANAGVDRRPLRGASGVPTGIAVVWVREVRTGVGDDADDTTQQQGVIVWQPSPLRGGRTRWRIAYARRFDRMRGIVGIQVGDATGDGRDDVLVNQLAGSGGCGVERVISGARQIFGRYACESSFRIGGGTLRIDEPVGPCPYRGGSAHCFGGRRRLVERWDGRRFVVVGSRTVCNLARLDPRRGCRRRA